MTPTDTTAAAPLGSARVADAMHPGVFTCPPETRLAVAGRMMARYRIHAVVVTDLEGEGEGEDPWRIVSDLDVARAMADEGFRDKTAGGVAGGEVVTVAQDAPLREAARLMGDHRVSHLIVSGHGGAPIGILSTLDLAAFAAGA